MPASNPQAAKVWAANRTVTLRIAGIGRNGKSVQVNASVAGANGYFPYIGHTVKVRPGRYTVAAAIQASGGAGSVTLAARIVTVTRSMTVKLDARRGRLVRVSLNVPGASQLGQTASLCLANSGNYFPAASGGWNSAGALYATPLRDMDVLFAYEGAWQRSPDAQYDLAGAVAGAIPARPDYSVRASRLAKVIMQVRSGTSLSDSGDFSIEPVFGGDCSPSASAFAGGKWSGLLSSRSFRA